jgi:hypothetical protein
MAVEWGVWGTPKPGIPLSKDDPCNRARWMGWTRKTERTEANAREWAAMLEQTAGRWWTFEARVVAAGETC